MAEEKYEIYELGEAPAPQLHGLIVVSKVFFKRLGRIHGIKLSRGDRLTLVTGKDKLQVECEDSFGRS